MTSNGSLIEGCLGDHEEMAPVTDRLGPVCVEFAFLTFG